MMPEVAGLRNFVREQWTTPAIEVGPDIPSCLSPGEFRAGVRGRCEAHRSNFRPMAPHPDRSSPGVQGEGTRCLIRIWSVFPSLHVQLPPPSHPRDRQSVSRPARPCRSRHWRASAPGSRCAVAINHLHGAAPVADGGHAVPGGDAADDSARHRPASQARRASFSATAVSGTSPGPCAATTLPAASRVVAEPSAGGGDDLVAVDSQHRDAIGDDGPPGDRCFEEQRYAVAAGVTRCRSAGRTYCVSGSRPAAAS